MRTALSLDDGKFRAIPAPSGAAPKVSAALAFCNLLAGVAANDFLVTKAAPQHGLSFGFGLVTVADSVLKTGPRIYIVGNSPQSESLQPYHARLAWIAVVTPDLTSSCTAASPTPPPTTAAQQARPGYQVFAMGADTGADGIIYSAYNTDPCGGPGSLPASVAPAAENVSVPWTLVKRSDTDSSSNSVTYPARPCDARTVPLDLKTGQGIVYADRNTPITVALERTLKTCGPAVPVPALLRGYPLATDLPQHLVHAPTGAQDVPAEGRDW